MKSYLFKIYKEKKPVYSSYTKSKRRINNKIEDYKWKPELKGYIKVSYGKGIDCDGQKTTFSNDAFCANEIEARNMLDYFDEMAISDWR